MKKKKSYIWGVWQDHLWAQNSCRARCLPPAVRSSNSHGKIPLQLGPGKPLQCVAGGWSEKVALDLSWRSVALFQWHGVKAQLEEFGGSLVCLVCSSGSVKRVISLFSFTHLEINPVQRETWRRTLPRKKEQTATALRHPKTRYCIHAVAI